MRTTLLRAQLVLQLCGAAAVTGYCLAAGTAPFEKSWYLVALMVAAAVASEALPVIVVRAGARLQYDAGTMVIVAAAMLFPTRVAVLTIAVGVLLGTVSRREGFLHGLNNVTAMMISAFVALNVAQLVGSPGLTPRSIAGAVIAGFTMDFCSFFLVATSMTLHKGGGFWSFCRNGLVAEALAPWMISVGVLIGAIGWSIPWALPLAAAPLALVFLSSRARVEATEDRARLDGLLGAASDILKATSVSGVIEATTASAATLLEAHGGRIDTEEPAADEIGVTLVSERLGRQNLVVGARESTMYRYSEQDRRLLETLASIAASALDRAALHEDVTAQATTDALTGLRNRRSFERELKGSTGNRSTDASGVIFLDLDGFKEVNDTHGHQAGDEVLKETAHRLVHCVRDIDTVARLGGDEFTILLRGVQSAEDAIVVADRVLASMRRPIELSSGTAVTTTPSVGIALALEPGLDAVRLLHDADAAMYAAKRAGKDCWRMSATASEDLQTSVASNV
jgi:diguanylate cyclase (GGDEF)-like protein